MKKLLFYFSFLLMLFACSNEEMLDELNVESSFVNKNILLSQKEAESRFSKILSKALYKEPGLRSFLKNEALLKKDNDYNIFYPLSKDKIVEGTKTFADILNAYCDSCDDLAEIEKSAPLLNIFIPDLSIFDKKLAVDKLDINDSDIPVLNAGRFYWQGEVVDSISKESDNYYPIFQTFVVNESSRRKIKCITTRGASSVEYEFSDEAFNPVKNTGHNVNTRGRSLYDFEENEITSEEANPDNLYVKKSLFPSETLNMFAKSGAGTGMLRTMMYYNLNKIEDINSDTKALDNGVRDVIFRMKVDPYLYYLLSSHKLQGQAQAEFQSPYLKPEFSHKGSRPAFDYVLAQLWTQGNFVFKINYVTGSCSHLLTIAIPPQKLFSAKITGKYKHKTWGHRPHYYLHINPTDLKAKWIYPHEMDNLDARFASWDPFSDSYKRTIFVSVAGSSITVKKEVSVSNTVMNKNSASITSGVKIPISEKGGEQNLNISSSWESQNTQTITSRVLVEVSDQDVSTGDNVVNFFGKSHILSIQDDKVYLDTERFGCFDMCIIPVKGRLYRH